MSDMEVIALMLLTILMCLGFVAIAAMILDLILLAAITIITILACYFDEKQKEVNG